MSDYDCPYCDEVISVKEQEHTVGHQVLCSMCKKTSELRLLPLPSADNLNTKVWTLVKIQSKRTY